MTEFNESQDNQRTPTYTQNHGIPIPEKDILDPVAEYNRGELAAMEVIERVGFSAARAYCDGLILAVYDKQKDFIQGFADALEVIAQEEA